MIPVMVGLRLFLPESWTGDAERMARARVPLDRQKALTKPEIAIEEIDRVIASGARFGCVLADAGYGSSGPFRQALSERGLLWAVGLSRRQNVYRADIGLVSRSSQRAGAAGTIMVCFLAVRSRLIS
jgi:SRSO17 transposase